MNIQNNVKAVQAAQVNHPEREQIILDLYKAGAIKFGNFTLKSGIQSPFYLDLRVVISFPQLVKQINNHMWQTTINVLEFDAICGVPYTGLPFAIGMSLEHNKPLVLRRKEVKAYGTQKAVEGIFKANDRCLIIEDIITSGGSILETTQALEHEGLKAEEIVILIDREQGGTTILNNKGYKTHVIFTLTEVLSLLRDAGKINSTTFADVTTWVKQHQFKQS